MKRPQGGSWWFEQMKKAYDKLPENDPMKQRDRERRTAAVKSQIIAKLKTARVSDAALLEHFKGAGVLPGWVMDVQGMVAAAPEFCEQLLRSWDSSIKPLLPREPESEQ